MTRPGYKMTEIGEIPEEWECTMLGDPKIINEMKAGGTPLKSIRTYYEHGTIPFVKIEDIVRSSKYLTSTLEHITEDGLKNSSSWLSPKDSILFSMYASYGEVCINKIPVATNQAIITIVPKRENVDVTFLYYELKSLKSSLKQYLRSTTQSNLNGAIIKELKIIVPPLPEQQKIAEILSTADETIQKVNDQIIQTERLKKGLMQTLLTKGIGHTKFKMTEIGEIPEEWEIEELNNICVTIRNGLTNKQDTNGVPISRIETISDGNFSDKFGLINSITEPLFSKYRLKVGDILISHINSIEHIGKAAIYRGIPKVILHGMNLLLLRFDTKKTDPFFYIQFLKYDKTRNIIRSLAKKAVNQASISQSELSKLLFPIPPLPEQQKITEILSKVDNKLLLLRNKKAHLEKLKKGLMGDILTGKVRVKINTSKGEN